MWVYSNVDKVKFPELLKLVRSAGIKWLILVFESGDREVRLEVSKCKFEDVYINQVIKLVHEADIEVMANYIFRLTGVSKESMKKTLDLSIELCTLGWNSYFAIALPGSKPDKDAVLNNIPLPNTIMGFHYTDTILCHFLLKN